MSEKKFTPENPCTWELQASLFDTTNQKLTSNIFDCNGKEVQLDDTLELVFNEGEYAEHKAKFNVVWKDAGYKIKSVDTGNESYLGSISHNVKITILTPTST